MRRRQPLCPTNLPAREGRWSLYFRTSSDASPTKVEDMVGIILEGVLFVAFLATIAALLFFGAYYLTPFGLRLKQNRNRRELERELDLTCPIHGLQREEEMVRLPSGSRICPVCYK